MHLSHFGFPELRDILWELFAGLQILQRLGMLVLVDAMLKSKGLMDGAKLGTVALQVTMFICLPGKQSESQMSHTL